MKITKIDQYNSTFDRITLSCGCTRLRQHDSTLKVGDTFICFKHSTKSERRAATEQQ